MGATCKRFAVFLEVDIKLLARIFICSKKKDTLLKNAVNMDLWIVQFK